MPYVTGRILIYLYWLRVPTFAPMFSPPCFHPQFSPHGNADTRCVG